MTKTCENCKWWHQMGSIDGECGHPYLKAKPAGDEEMAISTRPEFGCNQWQGKESGE